MKLQNLILITLLTMPALSNAGFVFHKHTGVLVSSTGGGLPENNNGASTSSLSLGSLNLNAYRTSGMYFDLKTILTVPQGADPSQATWAVASGSLPNGVSLTNAGLVTGTPTTFGTYSTTISATLNGQTSSQMYTYTISSIMDNAKSFETISTNGCAVLQNGSVACWGNGSYVDGSNNTYTTPKLVAGISDVSDIKVGSAVCALKSNGEVWCWGNNSLGYTAQGTTVGVTAVPSKVNGLGAVVNLWNSDEALCAKESTGTVKCWGSESFGDLGSGTSGIRSTPITFAAYAGAKSIAIGQQFSCAVAANGTVICTGLNSQGQLGDGSYTTRTSPVVANANTTNVKVVAGVQHACSLDSTKGMWCWGDGNNGQIGLGDTADRPTKGMPVVGGNIYNIADIGTGYWNTCAQTVDNGMYCWGYAPYGMLGNGGTTYNISSPTRIANYMGSSYATLKSKRSYSCSTIDGVLGCWGIFQPSGAIVATPNPLRNYF